MGSRPATDRVLLALAAASILLLLTAASFRRIWEADFFWQWKTGAVVAAQGPPRLDTLSYVSQGRPWIEMRWLYCRLLHGIVALAGYGGAGVAKWLVVLAAFGLSLAAAPWRRGSLAACAVLPLAILASSQRFFVRPELATFLFFSAYVCLLVRARQGSPRLLYMIPVLQVLWANLHTLFLLGPALVGLALLVEVGRARGASPAVRRLALVLAATCVACLATPYGPAGVGFGLHLVSEMKDPVFHRISAELAPTLSFGQRYTAVLFYEALAGACVLLALTRWRRLDPFLSLLLVSQLVLSLTSIRNLPLFCLAAIPFAVAHAPDSVRWPAPLRRGTLVLSILLSLGAAWSLATDRFHVWQHDSNQFGLGLASHRFPVEATRFVKERVRPRKLFHPMFEGSYLAAQGVPTFIDPRLEVHGRDHLAEYARMMDDAGAWKDAVAHFGFDAAQVDLGSPFLRFLLPEWRLVYFDTVDAVFVREGSALSTAAIDATAALARQALGRPRPYREAGLLARVSSPLPALRLATFLVQLGHVETAAPFAEDALAAYPRVPGAHEVLGRAAEARGDLARALAEYQAELALSPENVVARRQTGLLLFRQGRAESAREPLERTVERLPADAEAWAVLTKIHADAGRLGDALGCAEKAAALEPERVAYVTNLGRLYAVAGRTGEGIAALRRGLALAPADGSVRRDLALLLARQGRWEEALALAPDDPELLRLRSASP